LRSCTRGAICARSLQRIAPLDVDVLLVHALGISKGHPHAYQECPTTVAGEDVLIKGAGPIGCMAAALARFVGARHIVVTDTNEYRLDLARRMGATLAVPATDDLRAIMARLGMTEGYDIGLEMSGSPAALTSMLAVMNNGGRVALLGIPSEAVPIDVNQIIFRGLTLKGIYGREMFETWYRMGTMLQSGLDISPVITHRFPADRFAQAFEVVRSGDCGKVVMDWTA